MTRGWFGMARGTHEVNIRDGSTLQVYFKEKRTSADKSCLWKASVSWATASEGIVYTESQMTVSQEQSPSSLFMFSALIDKSKVQKERLGCSLWPSHLSGADPIDRKWGSLFWGATMDRTVGRYRNMSHPLRVITQHSIIVMEVLRQLIGERKGWVSLPPGGLSTNKESHSLWGYQLTVVGKASQSTAVTLWASGTKYSSRSCPPWLKDHL